MTDTEPHARETCLCPECRKWREENPVPDEGPETPPAPPLPSEP